MSKNMHEVGRQWRSCALVLVIFSIIHVMLGLFLGGMFFPMLGVFHAALALMCIAVSDIIKTILRDTKEEKERE